MRPCKLSIVIPTLSPEIHLREILISLSKINNAYECDVLIVGNKAKDLIFLRKLESEFSESFYEIRSFVTGVKSANVARNLGIRFSRGSYIFFLDDDCFVTEGDYLEKVIHYLNENPNVSGVGGRYEIDLNYTDSELDKTYEILSTQWLERNADPETHKTRYLIGGNSCYRREIFDEGYAFDPRLNFGGTETSLNFQLYRKGKELHYLPSLKVIHRSKISLYQFIVKAYRQGRGRAHNFKFNHLEREAGTRFIEKDINNFYSKVYDYFFNLGANSNLPNQGFSEQIWIVLKWLVIPPRFKSFIKESIVGSIQYVFTLIYLFFLHAYYMVPHKIFCKIYYMSEYHWRVYLKPLWKKFFTKVRPK